MSYAQGGDDAGFAIFFYIFLLYYILLSIFSFLTQKYIGITFSASEPENHCPARLLNEYLLCISASRYIRILHSVYHSAVTMAPKVSSTCGYSPVFHSLAPIFDAPGVGSAMVTTPEAMMNRLLFISDRKVLRDLNMCRRPTTLPEVTSSVTACALVADCT